MHNKEGYKVNYKCNIYLNSNLHQLSPTSKVNVYVKNINLNKILLKVLLKIIKVIFSKEKVLLSSFFKVDSWEFKRKKFLMCKS